MFIVVKGITVHTELIVIRNGSHSRVSYKQPNLTYFSSVSSIVNDTTFRLFNLNEKSQTPKIHVKGPAYVKKDRVYGNERDEEGTVLVLKVQNYFVPSPLRTDLVFHH